jgi:hypothetical protein
MRETYCPAMLLVYNRRRGTVSVNRENDFFVPFQLDQTRQKNTAFITPTTQPKKETFSNVLLKPLFASVLKIWCWPPSVDIH